MPGSFIFYLKGMRIPMFHFSGFYYKGAVRLPLQGYLAACICDRSELGTELSQKGF